MIRLAFHKSDIKKALNDARIIKEKFASSHKRFIALNDIYDIIITDSRLFVKFNIFKNLFAKHAKITIFI